MPSRPTLLHRWATAIAVATFVLLIAGSLVTSTDSGLAVPDWPLSYGTWFPPMVGGIRFEHGHRMIAGCVGLMILALAVGLWRREPRAWVRRLGYAALAGVILQAVLGGLTVLLLLPPAISIAHACLGQTVFCLIVCLALATSPGWEHSSRSVAVSRPLRLLSAAVAVLAAAQLVLGAVIRHTGQAVVFHIGGAVLLCAVAGWTGRLASRRRRDMPAVWAHARHLLILLTIQAALGASVLLHRGSVALRTGHVAMGAVVLAQAVVLAWEALRGAGAWRRSAPGIVRGYLELTKPRLTSLVLVTTAAGFWLGMTGTEQMGRMLVAMLGTALVAGGANALNEWMERDLDAVMERTKRRPIPAGRVSADAARWFGWLLIAAGLSVLCGVNGLAMLLAAVSAALYLFLYTPLKRRTPLCTLAGAIPGALPPMIGWAAARGTVGLEARALFVLLFVWQLPHFLAIATLYREDYAKAGCKMLPVTEAGGRTTARQMVLYGLVLLPISLFPSFIGLAGRWYFYAALGLSALFLAAAVRAALVRSVHNAQMLFRSSLAYLPILLAVLMCDKGPR